MYESLDWWIKSNPFTEEEREILTRDRSDEAILSDKYEELEDRFFNYIPGSNITSKTHEVSFACFATTLIQLLFKAYVDNDTLVVSTDGEHNSARSCVEKSQNTLILSRNRDILTFNYDKVINEAKKFKKTFIYIIGTNISDGSITPQEYFVGLRKELIKNNIDFKIVLDDVQGMLFVPRDYNVFDYVIYTSHVLTLKYDLGMVINTKGLKRVGYKIANWLEDYLKCLEIIMKRQNKFYTFKPMLFDTFTRFTKFDNFSWPELGVAHIFSPKIKNIPAKDKLRKKLEEYKITVDGLTTDTQVIRHRIGEMILYKDSDLELYKKGLDYLYNYIETFRNM